MSSPSPPPHSLHLPSQEEGDTETRDPQGPAAASAAAAGPRRGLRYLRGFGNSLESEALPGALPVGRNNPRAVPYGLYAEQVSGTAFTAPRHENRRTWLYRVQPGVVCGLVREGRGGGENGGGDDDDDDDDKLHRWFGGCDPADCRPCTDPCRWKPLALPPPSSTSTAPPPSDFCSGMRLVCTSGPDPSISIYMYACTDSMQRTHLCNTDGDFLIVPQLSDLRVVTEAGRLEVRPGEICVVPRGVVFQVRVAAAGRGQDQRGNDDEDPPAAMARGYVLEVNKGHFALPELGPIGSNGLANARDFEHPVAWCVPDPDEYRTPNTILYKVSSRIYERPVPHSPYNVVAWHGNYLPYKYNLERFCAVNSVTYDHVDPSIYTVLTCQSDRAGTALADFVVFPSPRVMATDPNTFRPPWFHRNCMSEFMGLIRGSYDAKVGFVPGGASLHNCMTPHGPDSATYQKAVEDDCSSPTVFDGGLAFMFETCLPLRVSPLALDDAAWRDAEYNECWHGLADTFTGWEALRRGAAREEEE